MVVRRAELRNGKGAECESHARWLLDRCPELRHFADAGIISPTHVHNALYAHRAEHQQMAEEGRYPSNSMKFAVNFADDPRVWMNKQPAWHGNVSGRHLFTILSSGLRGYQDADRTPSGRVSDQSRLPIGHVLVTPSWLLAMENYGYGLTLDDGSQLRMMVQVRCPHPTRKASNTWLSPPFRDVCHDLRSIEWYVIAKETNVTGLVVKHYTSKRCLRYLEAIESCVWRRTHMSMYGCGDVPRSVDAPHQPSLDAPQPSLHAAPPRPAPYQHFRMDVDPPPEEPPVTEQRGRTDPVIQHGGRHWRVVSGGESGGIIVRAGQGLGSVRLPVRLEVGALVSEIELKGVRLHFKKLQGSGPAQGWVSTQLTAKDATKPLLEVVKDIPKPSPKVVQQLDHCCNECRGCIRPPGHEGPCIGGMLEELRSPAPPCAGRYIGQARDVTCPGDHVTFDIVLEQRGMFSLECIPQMSYFAGGQPPWHCAGTWAFDGYDVVATITKADLKGPREDAVVLMAVGGQGNNELTVYNTKCIRRLEELRPPIAPPRAGRYIGQARDVTCPGDHVTFDIVLEQRGTFSLECIPQMSYFAGGQPPWHCAGDWAFDGYDVVVTITKADLKGPREDAVVLMAVGDQGNELTVYNTKCKRR